MEKIFAHISRNGSTIFLRAALTAVGAVVALLAILIVRGIYTGWNDEYPELSDLRVPFVVLISGSLGPFYFAISRAFKILTLIDRDRAFSKGTVMLLSSIKNSAYVFAAVYASSMYIIFRIAQYEDAPGLILIFGSIFVGIPVIVGVFLSILQRLIRDGLRIKSENDLTV